MDSAATWTVDQHVVLAVVLGLFGLSGYRRGIDREFLLAVGILLAMAVSGSLASSVQHQVNRVHKLSRFALVGGLTSGDPSAAWRSVSGQPALVQTSADLGTLGVAIFLMCVLLFYMIGEARPANASVGGRVLGLLVGSLNGYLVARYLFPTALPKAMAIIAVPSGEIRGTLSDTNTIARVVVFAVLVLIAFGLHGASGQR